MIMLRDSVIQDIIQFLEHCEGNDPGQELIRSSCPGGTSIYGQYSNVPPPL